MMSDPRHAMTGLGTIFAPQTQVPAVIGNPTAPADNAPAAATSGTSTTSGSGQSTGGSGAGETYLWDLLDYAGANVMQSGSKTGSLTEAIMAVRAAGAGQTGGWYGVVRLNGSTVWTGGSDANAGHGGQGGSQGGQTSDTTNTGGQGQAGSLTFTFTVTGWVWVYDDKTSTDPRNWTGHATEPVIQTTGGYGSASDALTAGKAVGDANTAVMKVEVVCDTPGFAGAEYIYTQRLQDAQNAVAQAQTFKPPTNPPVLPLPSPGPDITIPPEAIAAAVAVIAVVAIIAVVMSVMGGN